MNRFRPVVVFALVALFAVAASSTAFARTINVPSGKPTIQAAIAVAVNGDVVVVAKGTYKENIDFRGKAITVKSTYETNPSAIAATIIDGDKKGSVVTFKSGETATSVLRGFTITRGQREVRRRRILLLFLADPDQQHHQRQLGATDGGGVYCSGPPRRP